MAHKFPDIRDIPDDLGYGLEGILSDMKECLELMLGRRTDYLPVEDKEPANKEYIDDYVENFVRFVDRGDPSSVDFDIDDLTCDGNWNELDLSSIVPAETVTVALYIRLLDIDSIGSDVWFRKNGNSNEINISRVRTQVANNSIYFDVIVAVDSNRVIEYKADAAFSSGAGDMIDIVVKGYWK